MSKTHMQKKEKILIALSFSLLHALLSHLIHAFRFPTLRDHRWIHHRINYALALPLVSCLDVELSDSVSKRRKRLKSRR